MAGVPPDPANSLRALLDRDLRAQVVAANRGSREARISRNSGEGHAFYVDSHAGFARADQDALIAFLLSLTAPADSVPLATARR